MLSAAAAAFLLAWVPTSTVAEPRDIADWQSQRDPIEPKRLPAIQKQHGIQKKWLNDPLVAQAELVAQCNVRYKDSIALTISRHIQVTPFSRPFSNTRRRSYSRKAV